MQRLVKGIEESAEEWGISARVAWWIVWLPVVTAVAVLASYASRPLYRFVTQEDGPIEWAQVIFYAGAALAGAGIAYKRLRAGHPWQALLFAGFALMNFFIVGEEIAWGQRIFGIETPKDLKEINDQGEITLHNIGFIQDVFNFALFLAGGYGAVAYIANKKLQMERYWDQANFLLVPPLFLAPSFLLLFVYKLVRYTVVRTPGFTVTRYAELAELSIAFGFCLFAWLNYRRLAAQEEQAIGVPEAALSDPSA